jgi:hypothetical protein
MIPSQSHKLIQVVVQNNMKYNPWNDSNLNLPDITLSREQ